MADVMSQSQRSALMSRIRGSNTTPEVAVRSMLWRDGFRFRLHAKKLVGRPDIVLSKWRAVVLVHGCFWHAHENCRLFRLPATRAEFWQQKLASNRDRDVRTILALEQISWRVVVVWECALRDDPEGLRVALGQWIRSGRPSTQYCGKDGRLLEGALQSL